MKQTITLKQALEESTRYFNGDELATNVWVTKYALKDSAGNIYESNPSRMHHRLAAEMARIEKKYPNPYTQRSNLCLV